MTDAERFSPLHAAADALVAELVGAYEVEVREGVGWDPELAAGFRECLRLMRLVPKAPNAAPISFAWTGFPGVHVRLGRWFVSAFPRCGCDACDEDLDELLGELGHEVGAVVAGGFSESFDGSRIAHELVAGNRRGGGMTIVEGERALTAGAPGSYRWAPWTRR